MQEREDPTDRRAQATPETDPRVDERDEGDAPEAKGFETEGDEGLPPDQEAFQTDSD